MLILGIETSCDETGVALYDARALAAGNPPIGGLRAQAVYSQVAMHEAYGGVVPEIASRDHIRRLLPLSREVLRDSGARLQDLELIAYTAGPGLAGALLVGASFAEALTLGLGIRSMGVHHLEGHLLSPLLGTHAPAFPFVALLVSGGHTQLMLVEDVGRYRLLGETQDDAAGEAFDKTAKLLGLGYPGGPALARLASHGTPGRFHLPRPMIASGDLEFSFSGLKTAALLLARRHAEPPDRPLDSAVKADIARAFEDAVVDVLAAKCLLALERTGLTRLVVAGGVGANDALRARLTQASQAHGYDVFYPAPELCTDNGAMIAFAAAMRVTRLGERGDQQAAFTIRPRWDLTQITDCADEAISAPA